jgi:hypothetical protein
MAARVEGVELDRCWSHVKEWFARGVVIIVKQVTRTWLLRACMYFRVVGE